LLGFDSFEDVSDGAWKDSGSFFVAKHRVCLSRGGLSVHKDGSVVPIKSLVGYRPHHIVVDLRSANLWPETRVKTKVLLLGNLVVATLELTLANVWPKVHIVKL
jgi:hypothetical protein